MTRRFTSGEETTGPHRLLDLEIGTHGGRMGDESQAAALYEIRREIRELRELPERIASVERECHIVTDLYRHTQDKIDKQVELWGAKADKLIDRLAAIEARIPERLNERLSRLEIQGGVTKIFTNLAIAAITAVATGALSYALLHH